MPPWFAFPDSGAGWAFWVFGWAIQFAAVVVVLRDTRGRRFNGWDVAALVFVIALGWLAACYFLAVHVVLKARVRRKSVV